MATTLPTLPTEIWIRVLEYHKIDQNLPELWTSLRQVCTSWKKAIESIFRDRLLPKTYINFDLGEPKDQHIVLSGGFEFSYLSEDKVIAYFKIDDDVDPEYRDVIKSRLQFAVLKARDRPSAPDHTIQIRRDVRDGPIPGLSINYDNFPFELSCDWRQMFTMFWGEIHLDQSLLSGWAERQRGWVEGLRARVDRGQLSEMDILTQSLTAFASAHNDNLKKARRARIEHQWKLEGLDLNYDDVIRPWEEKRAIERLKRIRQIADLQEFSDDEDAEDDESDGEEDGDDDGWVDEDEEEPIDDEGPALD